MPPGALPGASSWLQVPNNEVDLFCAGQTLLPDGRVFVVGGQTGGYYFGIDTATIYDPWTSTWADPPNNRMANRRWYPSLITLPNGEVLALSGTQNGSGDANLIPEVWKTGAGGWRELSDARSKNYTYPWLSIDPSSGRVFMAGPFGTKYLSTVANGKISAAPKRRFALRNAGTFAVFGPGQVLAVGGGDFEHLSHRRIHRPSRRDAKLDPDAVDAIRASLRDRDHTGRRHGARDRRGRNPERARWRAAGGNLESGHRAVVDDGSHDGPAALSLGRAAAAGRTGHGRRRRQEGRSRRPRRSPVLLPALPVRGAAAIHHRMPRRRSPTGRASSCRRPMRRPLPR